MKDKNNISKSTIFRISTENEFNNVALAVFRFQYEELKTYQDYCNYVKVNPLTIDHYSKIPFLPIQFFKSKKINSDTKYDLLFKSSGTTDTGRSFHYVRDVSWYKTSFLNCFHLFYGAIEEITLLALLPSYQEQGDSSLVYMIAQLIEKSNNELSGFYLDNAKIIEVLKTLNKKRKKTILIGVSYALLDLIAKFKFDFPDLIVMETGGMKGRRKELTKEELHRELAQGFGVEKIHSEYGMTELLSQAYSNGDGIYRTPPWMKILTRSISDPFEISEKNNKTGGINIIDLANLHSCAFIATQDLGRISRSGFQIMGRFDHSDTRGCNLLVQ